MFIRLKRAIGACIWANVLLIIVAGCQHYFGTAHAATYYVATTGDNSNPGTEDKPFRTITHAVNTMVAGDTTYVRGGTYNETVLVQFKVPGTSSAQIKLLSYPGESPILNCAGSSKTTPLGILIQHKNGYKLAMGWITIEGFEIKNCWDGIKMYNAHDSTFRRNWVHDNLNQGILGNGTRLLIDRNIINHNGPFATKPTSYFAQGVYLHGSAITITNNLIHDNLGYGIQQNGSSSAIYDTTRHPGPEFASAANWVIANNTIAYQVNRAGIVVWGARCNNARIENNIFYENSRNVRGSANGINFTSSAGASGVQVRNNLFYASGLGGTAPLNGTQPSDLVFTENIVNVSNPAFVNAPAELPASPNFSLTPRSPVIDKGLTPSDETPVMTLRTAFDNTTLKARRTDFVGTARPQGRAHDIGAYEYRTDGDTQSPTPVQSVQIR